MHVDLSPSELDFLLTRLDGQVGRMLVEIRRTDHRDYKQDLKQEEEVLESLLKKLKAVRAAA